MIVLRRTVRIANSLGMASVAVVLMGNGLAAEESAAFRMAHVSGDVGVRLPGMADFRQAVAGKSYPSGSSVWAGLRATGVVSMPNGSECTVSTGSVVTVRLDGPRETVRLALEDGRVTFRSPERGERPALTVETALVKVGGAIRYGGVEVRTEADWKTVRVEVGEGKGTLDGPVFQASELLAGRSVSVACSTDRLLFRIRPSGGTVPVSLLHGDGKPLDLDLGADGLLKLVLIPDGNGRRLLRALQIAADGRTIITDWTEAGVPSAAPASTGK